MTARISPCVSDFCVNVNVCSSDEPKIKLPQKVSPSLTQVLEKLDLNKKEEEQKKG